MEKLYELVSRWALCLCMGLLISACASNASHEQSLLRWDNNPTIFTEETPQTSADKNSAELIFVRATGAKKEPSNVYIEDRYLASLLPGAYTQQKICSGTVRVAAVLDDARTSHEGRKRYTQPMHFESGKTYYFELVDTEDKNDINLVAITRPQLTKYKKQSHAIARTKNCV